MSFSIFDPITPWGQASGELWVGRQVVIASDVQLPHIPEPLLEFPTEIESVSADDGGQTLVMCNVLAKDWGAAREVSRWLEREYGFIAEAYWSE